MYEVYSIFFSLIPHEEPAGVRKSNREERYTVKERQVQRYRPRAGTHFRLRVTLGHIRSLLESRSQN